jgi:hypothetical protein
MSNTVSFLLGSGFSKPRGYPLGGELYSILLNTTGHDFAFHTSGEMIFSRDGKKPFIGMKTSYDVAFDYCQELMRYYNDQRGDFDYEEFFDFLSAEPRDPHIYSIGKKYERASLTDVRIILNQLVVHFLKDKDNLNDYSNAPFTIGGSFYEYTGILTTINQMSHEGNVNIHTLNHDLLPDLFNRSQLISGRISDGFEELGSPYYGEMQHGGRTYKVRLPRYTGNYHSNIRLFKLHGSLDYAPYYTAGPGSTLVPDAYVKVPRSVGFSKLFKDRSVPTDRDYENCWVNYHADFLTGTTSKIIRYKEPLLYEKLFIDFEKNLSESASLIIIGYGGRDSEINRIIYNNFDHVSYPVYVVDPSPGAAISKVISDLNAIHYTSSMDGISYFDLTRPR